MTLPKVFFKQFFGAEYEGAKNSIVVILILFFAIKAAQFRLDIAPKVLYLTAVIFTAGAMWQTLTAQKNVQNLQGILVLPFQNSSFVIAYVTAMTIYTLITRTFLVLVIFFAVGDINIIEMVMTVLWAWNGCFVTTLFYLVNKKKVFVLLWFAGNVAGIFWIKNELFLGAILGISILMSFVYFMKKNAYDFYHPVKARKIFSNRKRKGSVFIYLFRYLFSQKSYIMNTIGLGIIAWILPLMLKPMQDFQMMPIGFAILSLNTPLCILLSGDRVLEEAVRMLPGQSSCFCNQYGLFIAVVNSILQGCYITSWYLQYGTLNSMMILAAIFFAIQSALLAVLLEWFFPIRNWKIESDLYHHKRKYIVPVIMMFLAGGIHIWSPLAYILFVLLVVEIMGVIYYQNLCKGEER